MGYARLMYLCQDLCQELHRESAEAAGAQAPALPRAAVKQCPCGGNMECEWCGGLMLVTEKVALMARRNLGHRQPTAGLRIANLGEGASTIKISDTLTFPADQPGMSWVIEGDSAFADLVALLPSDDECEARYRAGSCIAVEPTLLDPYDYQASACATVLVDVTANRAFVTEALRDEVLRAAEMLGAHVAVANQGATSIKLRRCGPLFKTINGRRQRRVFTAQDGAQIGVQLAASYTPVRPTTPSGA